MTALTAIQARTTLLDMREPILFLNCRREEDGALITVLVDNLRETLAGLMRQEDTFRVDGWEGIFPAKPMRAWLAYVDEPVVRLEYNGNITIRTSRARATFKPEQFPASNALHLLIVTDSDNAPPLPLVPNAWVQRACSTDKIREDLLVSYGDIASDGYRMHVDHEQPPTNIDKPGRAAMLKVLSNAHDLIQKSSFAAVPIVHLLTAAKNARATTKGTNHPRIILKMTPTALLWECEGANASAAGEITNGYALDGAPTQIDLKPAFLVDALMGLKGFAYLHVLNLENNSALYMRLEGQREALIMAITTP